MALRIGIIGQASRIDRENLEWGPEDTVFHTVRAALANTGLTIDEIDTVVQAGDDVMDGIAIQHVYLVEPAGSFLKEESKVERDGAWAVHYAIARLLSGKFRTAMIVAQSKASQCEFSVFSGMSADPFYLRPLGADGYSMGALQAQYYMQKSGATEEDFAGVAIKNRKNAQQNPRTMEGEAGDYSIEDVLGANPIATPINEMTAARPGDGCVVLILATEDYVKETKRDAAWITGVGLASDAYYPTYRDLASLESVTVAAEKARSMAGWSAEAVDFAEVHEIFAHQELMIYEALGLCPEGNATAFMREGRTSTNGDIPVNASGGALSGQIIYGSGLLRMMEASLQLRGQAGDSQLATARRAMVHAQAGFAMQANIVYAMEA